MTHILDRLTERGISSNISSVYTQDMTRLYTVKLKYRGGEFTATRAGSPEEAFKAAYDIVVAVFGESL